VWEEALRSADEKGEPPGATEAEGEAGRPLPVTMAGQGKGTGPVRCAPVVAAPVGAMDHGSPQGGVVLF
jgi:hypothetical protein